MPRYHFNVYDGHSAPDRTGIELVDIASARCEAIRFAGSILDNEFHHLGPDADWHLDVTDGIGLVLLRLNISIIESPAIAMCGGKSRRAKSSEV